MNTKRIHYLSGLFLAIFIGLHLFNHFMSIFGAETHLAVMESLRLIYWNIFVESLLLISVVIQIISGIKLIRKYKHVPVRFWEKLPIWTGFYLAAFLIIHVSAVFTGRLFLQLDTNFYFGAAGLNIFPYNLYFYPYYTLAIFSFFAHLACVHIKRMCFSVAGISPQKQAVGIIAFGFVLTVVIFYGQTNGFAGAYLPEKYATYLDTLKNSVFP